MPYTNVHSIILLEVVELVEEGCSPYGMLRKRIIKLFLWPQEVSYLRAMSSEQLGRRCFSCAHSHAVPVRDYKRESGRTALPSGTFIKRAAGEEDTDDLDGNWLFKYSLSLRDGLAIYENSVLPGDSGLAPSTHIGWVITVCNSSSVGSNVTVSSLQVLTHAGTLTYT